ncbi:hypothetical protein M0208_17280 [Sphingomonas sp. SUN019]|uniref:hypothetical protein n=1 Tax=Sphingomonas sp. SUN019 TaxID=2937788 RepID=UPI0021647D34|nr:hypothetical protein [Sphingomonas sp. SUN019]UVO52177.1 hypothetical protein M0208_17280 [Sphingomonas sp. SUN019]
MLRFGPDTGPTVIAALPLFEEANRTRAAMVDVLRRLAAHGIGGALPDLPGTGESLVETRDATLTDWREAFAAAAATLPEPLHIVAWRGGVLVDVGAVAAGRWHLAPTDGNALVRELMRVRDLGGSDDYAGNLISDSMISEVQNASSNASGTRTVRLASDPRPADAHIPGSPLWRASEPGTDAALQAAIADDIVRWIASCAD